MSFNDLFGNQSHTHHKILKDPTQANLGNKLNKVRDRRHTTQEIPLFDIGNSVSFTPVSAYGASLLDTTSLADLRATILENTNEEAIRLLADGNNEINFYTGGTGASNLKLQIKDNSIDVKNSATLNTANIVVGTNNHIKQKIENSGSRVLVESTDKQQYCLYSYAANTNSGLLIQARDVGNLTFMEINNYKNSNNTHQPISINRTINSSSYVVIGANVNPTSISSADFVTNGQAVFCNANDVLLDVNSTNIQPYKNIIPSGSLDIGSGVSPFNQVYNNISTITNEIRLNTFVPVGSDYRQKGIFFREGFNSTSNGDNMCIRSIARFDAGPPAGNVGDRLMVSSYGGLSINYLTNNTGNDGTVGRIALFHNEITVHKNILPNADGTLDIGFKDSGASDKMFSNIYGNNLWAKTALHTASIRPYTNGNPIHFHNTSLTFDNTKSISVDNLFSSATNRDLYLGNGPSDIKMQFINGAGGETNTYSSIVPNNSDGLLNLGSPSKFFGNVYTTSVNCSTVTSNDLEANVSIKAVGNNAYLSAEDDNTLNGKVQIISENSSTYTGYVSFLKNDTRQMFLGFDNALQFENSSNFTIRSDAQTYLSFIHDANFANRKININVDLIPSSNSYDLGSFTERFAQIHGTTINASSQISTDLIAPYAGGISTSVQIDADFLPINPGGGGSGTRKLGNGSNLWSEVFASNATINTSDRNMKKDITPITNALQFVRKLKPVQYKWKKNSHGRTHTGFISQDVLEANPLGLGDNWSGYVDTGHGLGLRYGEFISVNTQAIKELDSKVSRLASGITGATKIDLSLHTPNEEIIERLEILENKKPLETVVEEYDDTELKQQIKQLQIDNRKQEDCISQLISENMNLTEKLNMLMERFDKFVNDKPNVELKIEEEQLLSDTGDLDMMENVQERLHIVEQKITKLTNKQAKLVTAVNKLKK